MRKYFVLLLLFLIACEKKEPLKVVHLSFPDPPLVTVKMMNPDLNLPDSLGGKSARGFIAITSEFTVEGKLLQYEITKIKISYDTTAPITIYSIYDSVTSNEAIAKMRRYAPWVDMYLNKATFKIHYDTNYHKFSPKDTLTGGATIMLPT
jgi:hypothetical protein